MLFFAPLTSMIHKVQPRQRMDPQTAKRLVARANAARRSGKLDMALENTFSVRYSCSQYGVAQLSVFRIKGYALEKELPLELFKNPELDPFHPLFDMDAFSRETPLTESRMD